MAVLLVTYDLKGSTRDYAPLHEAIKKDAIAWWHYLESVWLVNTTEGADALAKRLYPHITRDDRLLVIRVTNEYQGWLAKDAWDWLNSQGWSW